MKVKPIIYLLILFFLCSCGVRVNDEVLSKLPLSISPAEKTIFTHPGGLFFYVSGGKSPYKFSILQGEGKIYDGYFEAPEKPGLTVIEAIDDLQNRVSARINIIERK